MKSPQRSQTWLAGLLGWRAQGASGMGGATATAPETRNEPLSCACLQVPQTSWPFSGTRQSEQKAWPHRAQRFAAGVCGWLMQEGGWRLADGSPVIIAVQELLPAR